MLCTRSEPRSRPFRSATKIRRAFTLGTALAIATPLAAQLPPGTVPLTQPVSMTNSITSGNTVDFVLTIPANVLAGSPGTRRLHFGVRSMVPGSGLPYIEGMDVIDFRTSPF